jgi:endonuclease YncB( thermonuclease family)
MKRGSVVVFFLFVLSGVLYYMYADDLTTTGNSIREITAVVEKVVDGDTIVLDNGEKIRFLGINTPEKGEFYKEEAMKFTSQIENQTVRVEITEKDKYGRSLGYVFYNGKLLNEELLRNGFASLFVYTPDKYFDRLRKAEKEAIDSEVGIWKKSSNFGCLTLVEFKYLEDGNRCTNKERVVLDNSCGTLNVSIKDDATHIEHVLIKEGTFSKNYSCVFNDVGDSLYIWDKSGLLVFERY